MCVKSLVNDSSLTLIVKPDLNVKFLSTGSIVQACTLSIDAGGEVSDAVDGNLGDDDGDTWSQNDDEPYLGDT